MANEALDGMVEMNTLFILKKKKKGINGNLAVLKKYNKTLGLLIKLLKKKLHISGTKYTSLKTVKTVEDDVYFPPQNLTTIEMKQIKGRICFQL